MTSPLINESLRIIRLYWGKTQAELAEELGISQSYISEIEKARREVTLDLLGKYSRALNVPMSSLLMFAERVDGTPPPNRGKVFLAGRALSLLKKLIPDEEKEAD